MAGTPAEIQSAWEGLMAYYGTFEIDEQRRMIVHHVQGSSFPNWTGIAREQFYELTGDRLTLLTLPLTLSREQLVGQLLWQRMQ